MEFPGVLNKSTGKFQGSIKKRSGGILRGVQEKLTWNFQFTEIFH